MANAARILNDIVVEVVTLPEGVPLDECYHPDAGFVACPDGIEVGQSYKNGAFGPAPTPPAPTKPDLVAYAAWARWAKETGGVVVNGVTVATDALSQGKITAAYLKAKDDPTYCTKWKGRDGIWTPLSAAAIIAMGDACFAHVDASFVTEEDVDGKIASGTITTQAQIDAAFATPVAG